jgi:hypothetical protein
MDYRSLGRTGVHMSALCLGGMLFGEQTDEAEALMLIDRALDAGLNFVDTANIYTRGRSEAIIGRALQRNRHGWCWRRSHGPPQSRSVSFCGVGPGDETTLTGRSLWPVSRMSHLLRPVCRAR